jgi:hypothetical protein
MVVSSPAYDARSYNCGAITKGRTGQETIIQRRLGRCRNGNGDLNPRTILSRLAADINTNIRYTLKPTARCAA